MFVLGNDLERPSQGISVNNSQQYNNLPDSAYVSEEELRMLGLDPVELLQSRTENNDNIFDEYDDNNYVDYDDDDEDEDDDDDDEIDIDHDVIDVDAYYDDINNYEDDDSNENVSWSNLELQSMQINYPGIVIPTYTTNQFGNILSFDNTSSDSHSTRGYRTSHSSSDNDSNSEISNHFTVPSESDNVRLFFQANSNNEESENDSSPMESDDSVHSNSWNLENSNSSGDETNAHDNTNTSSSNSTNSSYSGYSATSLSSISFLDDSNSYSTASYSDNSSSI